ncbi:LOW QUALITY PROTEIN: uncharacterized protein LOC128265826 [Drosophila gunungcola]|uniref:LOW QUALITY PROTEIN: uncharacterized protein LOC128265826 n=1 Tax=Drosophila gunungcola TaxID=103775 RepID=UPI0022E6CA56|nr:LOW QUALITY PROTEIN: uncharacterized protein LOC128265826 [Drosophila gunungcola]
MPITGLCIELRPNLRSGVAFLRFDHQISQSQETRLVIRDHNVYISERPQRPENQEDPEDSSSDSDSEDSDDLLLIRHDHFGMDIGCLSTFLVSGSHISFRFNYNQIDLAAVDGGSVEVPLAPLLLSCRDDEAMSINCRDCRAELVEARAYRRLREFPSCVVDPSEFFCHSHQGHGCKTTQPPSLVPGEADLFYGLNYVVISLNAGNPHILTREDHLYCQRCMRFLGQTMFNGAAARLWADAVRWLPAGARQPAPERHFFQSSTLTQLVKRLLHSLWPQPLPQLCLSTSRALLVTSLPSRRHQYMFLHVVESQLRVLRRIRPDSNRLRCYRTCKLYYGIFGADPPPLLLEKWQAQQTLPQMEISPDMFLALQQRLELNGQLIPHAWRVNSAEEQLQLSYFFYEDEEQPEGVSVTLDVYLEQLSQLAGDDKQKEQDQYETDAGHASESDDEHSDSETDSKAAGAVLPFGKRTLPKRCPTPPRSCPNMCTSISSVSSEDK